MSNSNNKDNNIYMFTTDSNNDLNINAEDSWNPETTTIVAPDTVAPDVVTPKTTTIVTPDTATPDTTTPDTATTDIATPTSSTDVYTKSRSKSNKSSCCYNGNNNNNMNSDDKSECLNKDNIIYDKIKNNNENGNGNEQTVSSNNTQKIHIEALRKLKSNPEINLKRGQEINKNTCLYISDDLMIKKKANKSAIKKLIKKMSINTFHLYFLKCFNNYIETPV
ncbi:protein kinase, putative, partial [Hepatocystis sp. ex Piliocolobus tephrosceles]